MRSLLVAGLLVVAACETADTTGPTVTFAYPTDSATVGVGSVTVKVVAVDDKGVVRVEFYDGSAKLGDDVTAKADTFDMSWTATPGAHTLKAVASDAAGNQGGSTISVTAGGPTDHREDIVGGDSVWYAWGNPHIVQNTISIHENGKLTIKPGCIVEFKTGAGFVVGSATPGELVAVGTADSAITFTSYNRVPSRGDWQGFDFHDQTRPSTQLSYCDINYACYPGHAAVNIEGPQTIGVDNTTIHNSSNWGIWFGSHDGYITGFTANTVTGCARYPIYGYADKLGKLTGGNTLTGNGAYDAILVDGGNVTETDTWVNQGVPYLLAGDVSVGSSSGAYLTIARGTTVQSGDSITINVGNSGDGGLIADSVVFTSPAPLPRKGDWYSINFYGNATDAQCVLTDCSIGYGGGEGYGDLWLEDAAPTITGCNIHDSKAWGVYLSGSEYPDPDSLLAHNTFSANDSGDVRRP